MTVYSHILKHSASFKYEGASRTLSEDGKSDEHISCKRKQGKMEIGQLNSVFWCGKITRKL